MKRRVYRLKWDKAKRGWKCLHGSTDLLEYQFPSKAIAEGIIRRFCQLVAAQGVPCQLLIYTKAGRIGKGGRYEASYGCNSRRRKG